MRLGPKSGPSGSFRNVSRRADSPREDLGAPHGENPHSHLVFTAIFPCPNAALALLSSSLEKQIPISLTLEAAGGSGDTVDWLESGRWSGAQPFRPGTL
jgi:hypothetical protein